MYQIRCKRHVDVMNMLFVTARWLSFVLRTVCSYLALQMNCYQLLVSCFSELITVKLCRSGLQTAGTRNTNPFKIRLI